MNVTYKIESLSNLEKEIVENGNDLLKFFDYLLNELDELDNIYNTPSGKLYKEKMSEYIYFQKEYIKNNYITLKDALNMIISQYNNDTANIKKSLGDK